MFWLSVLPRPKNSTYVLENNIQLSTKALVAPAMPVPFEIFTPRRLGGMNVPTRKKIPTQTDKMIATIEIIILTSEFS